MRKLASRFINLPMPYTKQGKNSGNCGPCCLKMLADYYGVKKKDGQKYSVPSLNRLCQVVFDYGCEKSDMARVLKRLGLKRKKIKLNQISKSLTRKKPILGLFIDESGEGHYALIKGVKNEKLIFHDSYWGKNITRDKKIFAGQMRPFGDWIWEIAGP